MRTSYNSYRWYGRDSLPFPIVFGSIVLYLLWNDGFDAKWKLILNYLMLPIALYTLDISKYSSTTLVIGGIIIGYIFGYMPYSQYMSFFDPDKYKT